MKYQFVYLNWLVVPNTMEFHDFPIILGMENHPNWRVVIFFRGGSNHRYISRPRNAMSHDTSWICPQCGKHPTRCRMSNHSKGIGECMCHRIGWWENFNRKALYLMVKTMVSCRFSLKPIQCMCVFVVLIPLEWWYTYTIIMLLIPFGHVLLILC